MDFQITDGLSTFEVWLDDDVLEGFFSTGDHLELLQEIFSILLLIFLLVLHFSLFDEIFDLFLSKSQMVIITALIFVFKGQLFNEHSIWICEVWEE